MLKLLFAADSQVDIDEPFSLYWAQASISELFQMMKTENNPPFHFMVLHFWTKFFGTDPFAARFLSVLFSSLVVIFIYKTGAKFYNQQIGVFSSLLFTFSNLNMVHAHNARVYALFVLLSAASLCFFLSLYSEEKKRKWLVYLSITNLILIYSHYFGFWVLIYQTVLVLFVPTIRKAIFKQYAISTAVVFLLFIPMLTIFLSRFIQSAGQGTWVPTPNFESLYYILVDFCNQPVSSMFFIFLLIAFPVFLLVKKIKLNLVDNIILFFFLALLLIMFAVSFKVPMFIPQYLLYLSPAFYLFIGIIIFYTERINKKLSYGFMGCALVLLIATFNIKAGNGREPK